MVQIMIGAAASTRRKVRTAAEKLLRRGVDGKFGRSFATAVRRLAGGELRPARGRKRGVGEARTVRHLGEGAHDAFSFRLSVKGPPKDF